MSAFWKQQRGRSGEGWVDVPRLWVQVGFGLFLFAGVTGLLKFAADVVEWL